MKKFNVVEKSGADGVSYVLYIDGIVLTDNDGNEVKIVTCYNVTDLHFEDASDAVYCKAIFEKSLAYDLEKYTK
jgi:hypothetical protein